MKNSMFFLGGSSPSDVQYPVLLAGCVLLGYSTTFI